MRFVDHVSWVPCAAWTDGALGRGQEEFEQELSLPLARMEYGTVGQAYVLLQRAPESMAVGKLGANLQFTVKEIDPSSGQPHLSTILGTCGTCRLPTRTPAPIFLFLSGLSPGALGLRPLC